MTKFGDDGHERRISCAIRTFRTLFERLRP